MKNLINSITIIALLFIVEVSQGQKTQTIPERPENFKPYIYKHSTSQLKKFTKQHVKNAAKDLEEMDKVIFDGPYKASYASLSEHATPEWYMDGKFGIEVNYGIYSAAGYSIKGYGGNYYTDAYLDIIYGKNGKGDYYLEHWGEDFEKDDFIPLFTASELDADEYIKLFKEAGARFFVQFNMHRSTGMPLWDSKYTFRDPVDMPPHRDLTNEFVQACRKYGLPYGMYLNLEDTSYPLLAEDGEINIREWTKLKTNPIPVNGSFEVTHPFDPEKEARQLQGKVPVYDYVNDYLLPLAKECIDNYEPDYIWFDGGWKRPAWYYQSHKILAYYYNKFHGKKDVLVNSRIGNDLYGKLGDVAISEGGQMDGADPTAYWEENTPMGNNFAYDWRENDNNVKSSTELLHMLIRIVAKGGNLLLIVTPDGDGKIPDYQVSRLKDMGAWLKTNGESIYNTRPSVWAYEETNFGKNIFYTQSKDEKYAFAICLKLEEDNVLLSKARAKEGSEIKLLGYDKPLSWVNYPWGLTVSLPKEIQNKETRKGKHAWVLRFEPINDKNSIHQQNE